MVAVFIEVLYCKCVTCQFASIHRELEICRALDGAVSLQIEYHRSFDSASSVKAWHRYLRRWPRTCFKVAKCDLNGSNFANFPQEATLEDKVANFEAVFVEQVVSFMTHSEEGARGVQDAFVAVKNSLKGNAKGVVKVEAKGMWAEGDPAPLKVGSNYLFFVKKIDGDVYVSVNGRFGVYELPK